MDRIRSPSSPDIAEKPRRQCQVIYWSIWISPLPNYVHFFCSSPANHCKYLNCAAKKAVGKNISKLLDQTGRLGFSVYQIIDKKFQILDFFHFLHFPGNCIEIFLCSAFAWTWTCLWTNTSVRSAKYWVWHYLRSHFLLGPWSRHFLCVRVMCVYILYDYFFFHFILSWSV